MAAKTLEDLFLHTVKDIYHGEMQILKALPKMAKEAESEELKAALHEHLTVTQGQVARLDKVFKMLGKPAKGEPCKAIEGLVAEGQEVIEETEKGPVRDAGIIAAAQAVEHYEIARYGTLCAWAEELGMEDAQELLEETLEEEKEADEKLNEVALEHVNEEAA